MNPWLFTCEPGWEAAVAEELSAVFGAAGERCADGWVALEQASGPIIGRPSVAFARQCLPDAEPVQAGSIAAWARWIAPWLIERLREHDGPWRWHIFAAPNAGGEISAGRCELIEQAVLEILQKKQRRLVRQRVTEMAPLFAEDEALVQVALTTPGEGYASLCLPRERRTLGRVLSRFPGGLVEIAPDRAAPSRAFGKLAEAERRLGRPIQADETCVDLGSSPGSWAWLALARGAAVVAIDRSELREDLMSQPRLTYLRADAFRYEPPQPVDWLLSDVIAFPERILKLLGRWLAGRWCRFFCVTVKFRGAEEYSRLAEIKSLLREHQADFQLRRLTHNKNEVTAYGWAGAPGGALAEPVAHELAETRAYEPAAGA